MLTAGAHGLNRGFSDRAGGSIVREPACKGLGRNRQAESLTYTGSGSGVRRRTALAATLSGRFTLVYERLKTARKVTVSNTDHAAPLVVESGRLTAHVGSDSKDRNWDTCVEPIEKPRVTSHSESNIFEFIACSLSFGRIGKAISRIAGEGRHRSGVSPAGAQPTRTTRTASSISTRPENSGEIHAESARKCQVVPLVKSLRPKPKPRPGCCPGRLRRAGGFAASTVERRVRSPGL